MKRTIPGLSKKAGGEEEELPCGEYLVAVVRAHYRWQKQKPYYSLCFRVLQPEKLAGEQIIGRLYCTVKALWKLSWFLTDFGYDADLLDRDELDEKALAGLRGAVRVSYTSTLNGHRLLNLDAFAPADRWNGLITQINLPNSDREVA
jgi:hypothetical protein